MKNNFKYIYGPVPSWRLGSSLGIDLLSQQDKICNYSCIYCQLGSTRKYTAERKIYVPVQEVIDEIKKLPRVRIDYITFSGRGEPTLASNLGAAIRAVKKIRKEKVAVLTNASIMDRKDVRRDLALADLVVAKLDAFSQDSLDAINRPHGQIKFGRVLDGIKRFRKEYCKRLALQIMFTRGNMDNEAQLVYLAEYIQPDEVQINTPLRPCRARPLDKQDILKIKNAFTFRCRGIDVVSVYDARAPKDVLSISAEDTLQRRGKT